MRAVSVGILSIGEMGYGVATLLKAHGYRVLTVGSGRSEQTRARIQTASIESVTSDQDLVIQSDYIFSIVPPRDALSTAHRIVEASKLPDTNVKRQEIEDVEGLPTRRKPFYLDLNATSPRLATEVGSLFENHSSTSSSEISTPAAALCYFLDGGIIGPPPAQNAADGTWKKPSLVVSGPIVETVSSSPPFSRLAEILNMKVVSSRVGAASTLKLSFAALTKGFIALSILSLSTAQKESVLPQLLEHLQEYSPHTAAMATKSLTGVGHKAYRFVEEMHNIGEMFDSEGCWNGLGAGTYDSFAEVYRTVAEETELGAERVDAQSRGKTVEEAAGMIAGRKKTSGVKTVKQE